ncbi:MAG: 23S rRNA (adenine(2503)-C(2))-methyltransferase [Ignavibacteria bacterium RBG_13_36_8]|nr:MAG: 23S rRNA (adenine(2503)-C(2))-methyltransferase [Ignavibacteria bacterium RBG_13_36_8]
MQNYRSQIKNLTLEELQDYLIGFGEKKFRARQAFNWIYNHLITDFDMMKNIPKELRLKLSEDFTLLTLKLSSFQLSATTGTKKYLFETSDGHKIESVLIPEKGRNTLCISTQVGCPLDCKFCATGLMGYKRNLTVGEIVDQYLMAARDQGKKKITNIVYMGMGEPLLNYDNTMRSLALFTSEINTGISRNRITVSTSGIPQKIKELADSGLRVKLALSLHSCFEDVRSKIMPINKKYSLNENIEAIKYYSRKTKTRITFEYVMLNNVNDRNEDITAIAKLCGQIPSKVNVIPFNSIAHMQPGGISAQLESTSPEQISVFADELRSRNITVMVRETQGDDIVAACGQLANTA